VPVLQVFYASQVTGLFGVPQARRLVGEAQVLNRRSDITGLLAFTGTYFAQVVEGPTAAVEALMDRLTRDSRHSGLRVLRRGNAPRREFPAWSMALLESPQLETDLADLVHAVDLHDAAVDATLARMRQGAQWQTAGDLAGGTG